MTGPAANPPNSMTRRPARAPLLLDTEPFAQDVRRVLAQRWCKPPHDRALAIEESKAAGEGQRLVDVPGWLDLLPELACFQLWIAQDVRDGRDFVAEHVALHESGEELVFGQPKDEWRDVRLECVHLGLCRARCVAGC